jgi:hypothetical protein
MDQRGNAFLRPVQRAGEGGGMTNLDQQLTRIAKTHRVQMAMIESVQLIRELYERERQAEENRRANLARLGAANDRGDA